MERQDDVPQKQVVDIRRTSATGSPHIGRVRLNASTASLAAAAAASVSAVQTNAHRRARSSSRIAVRAAR